MDAQDAALIAGAVIPLRFEAAARSRGLDSERGALLVADGEILDRDVIAVSLPVDPERNPERRPGELALERVRPEFVDDETAVAGDVDVDMDFGEKVGLGSAARRGRPGRRNGSRKRSLRVVFSCSSLFSQCPFL